MSRIGNRSTLVNIRQRFKSNAVLSEIWAVPAEKAVGGVFWIIFYTNDYLIW